ncbi:MAG: alpha-N-arabinofuranosidase [Anaerolineae bacterium]|nr:alpha-N-arabinofuranosidase [Anaerolineae bacterium]
MVARIKIDIDRRLGRIDPLIYGQFVEHLGRCIYGGIYEEDSPLSDERGFRLDVLEAAKGLHPTILRWPGGNFVSGYHWEDGIGPKDQRPRRLELAWHAEESNRFGTDEFIEYCRALGAEPYICINLGTGTLNEARNWVEYCNGTGDTYYANLRRRNGHPEPYNVKYWGLGNEMYGHWQMGHKPAEEYARYAREAAKLMKRVDPSIKLISCGWDGLSDWDRIVLEVLAPYVDYHSIHLYTGSSDYYTNVFQPHHAGRMIEACQALIETIRYRQGIEHPIRIAFDEWNVWFRARGEQGLEERYTLADALAVSAYLNEFQRHPQAVGMANLAQMVNVIAPIFTQPDGLFRQAIYYPLMLYAEHSQSIALDAWVACDTFVFSEEPEDKRLRGLGPFPYLDVSATLSEAGTLLTLAVINRHRDQAMPTEIDLGGWEPTGPAAIYMINADDANAINDFGVERVGITEGQAEVAKRFTYEFPAHSLAVMVMKS